MDVLGEARLSKSSAGAAAASAARATVKIGKCIVGVELEMKRRRNERLIYGTELQHPASV